MDNNPEPGHPDPRSQFPDPEMAVVRDADRNAFAKACAYLNYAAGAKWLALIGHDLDYHHSNE